MLEIKDLTCGYDSKLVLKDINLRVESGEFLGVIGPNGSGKTTLLRAITRVIKQEKGSITFCGKDIARMGFNELARKIAVVSQNFEMGFMTVEEFVLLGRIPHYEKFQFLEARKDIEVAEESMALTDTLRLKDCLLREISSGERQLALIARALTQEPGLLLLDEPTSHLDITHQMGIMDLIRRLNKEHNLTVIMVLHDLNLAGEYCRKLVLINKGEIYKVGKPEEVLSSQTIEEVYKTTTVIGKNPVSSRPYCFFVSRDEKERRRSQ